MENLLLVITNEIFGQGKVPETLKVGLLTPIFKNKGLKSQATNYRCITVLPVISKIVETIIKGRIQKQVIETQNRKRRRLTGGSSPINSALPVEECYREVVDNNAEGQVILLDAKQHSTKLFIVTWKEGYIKRGLMINTGFLSKAYMRKLRALSNGQDKYPNLFK